ncbi:MAG TPA: hypothetical protein PLR69_12305 [Candidatus Limiplasma sp.]|nr:hypothetical protein [Candidatus Limiplasma sp.]HPR79371.1 hypothetical protein [Candidatus Limiplasma sp.]
MQYNMMLGADGRVLSVADTGFHCGEGEALVTVPDSFTLETAHDWVMVDGVLTCLPVTPEAEAIATPEPWEVNAANIDYLAMMAGVTL